MTTRKTSNDHGLEDIGNSWGMLWNWYSSGDRTDTSVLLPANYYPTPTLDDDDSTSSGAAARSVAVSPSTFTPATYGSSVPSLSKLEQPEPSPASNANGNVDVDVDVDVDAVNNTNANAISGGNSNGGDRTFGTTKWILMGSAATFGIVAVAILFCTGLFSAKRRKKNQNGGEHHHQQQEQHHRQQRGVVGARSINNASSLDSCSCYIQDDYGVGGDYDRDYHCNADDDCWSMSVLSVPQRPKADGNINGNGDDCNNGDRVVDADVDVDVDIEGGGRGEPLQQQQQHCQEEQEHQTQDDPLSRTASF